jgi:endonuclease IV
MIIYIIITMKIGAFVPKAKDFVKSLNKHIKLFNTNKFNLSIAQIFAIGPQQVTFNISKDESALIKAFASEHNILLQVHSAYVCNPFSKNTAIKNRSVGLIKKEIKTCGDIGALCLNVHIKQSYSIDAINTFVNNVYDTLEENKQCIYFENAPEKNPSNSVEKIYNDYLDLVNNLVHKDYIGFTIDTAHLWSSYINISNKNTAIMFLDMFDKIFKLVDYRIIFHLNDNLNPIGVLPDHHTFIGNGLIWKKSDTYKLFIDYAKEHNIPIILERKGNDYANDLAKLLYF